MLSIIIPTLNEEKYLPLLLKSLKKQEISSCEIIVADAGSEDRTIEIAKGYNCKIVPGGLPAQGRNNGAKIAKGDLLLFLDADLILPDDFLEKSLKEFEERNLKIASFCLFPCKGEKIPTLILNLFYNLPIRLMEEKLPHAAMGIIIEKKLFKKLGGFDESIKMSEDHDLARRVKKVGKKCGILRSSKIFFSERRFEKDGWLKTCLIYLFCEGHTIFIGPVRTDVFKYKFNHYFTGKKK